MRFMARPVSVGVIALGSLSLLVLCHCAVAEEPAGEKAAIIEAIRSGADYAANVLLDENGKSRCEYDMLRGKWKDYEPAWHTGQIVYSLIRAYEVTKDPKYLEAAKRGANWWLSLEIKDHPTLEGMIRAIHMNGIDYIIFSTISDGTAGLFRLYDVTGEDRYAAVPTRAGAWMYEHMWEPTHKLSYDAVDPETGEVQKEWSPFWPDKSTQVLYDVARPNNEGSLFKDMYEYTGDEKYKVRFLEVCDSLVEKQGPAGVWMDFTPNNKKKGYFHPRFPLWNAESLLDGYEMTGDKRYLEAALNTARVYARVQLKSGAIYRRNYLDGRADTDSICGSATAFAGILWLRLKQHGIEDEFDQNIDRSLRWLLENRFPTDHPDKNLAGAFINTRSRATKANVMMVNRDVGTSFGIRFLADYYEYAFK